MPRVTLRCPGKAMLADGTIVDIIVHDVSRDGLQIRCDKAAAVAIHPSAKPIEEKQGAPKLKMQFDVPLNSGPATVKVRGREETLGVRVIPDASQLDVPDRSPSRTRQRETAA